MEELQQIETAVEKNGKKKKKGIRVAAIVLALVFTAAASASVSWYAAKQVYRGNDGHLVSSVKQARDIIRNHYFYYEEDEQKLTEATLKGIAAATGDLYAEYYTAEEYEDLKKQNQRSFVGIGILTQINEEGNVEVLDVYDDTPASEAGLMRGDLLIEINGVPFTGMSLSEFLANVHAEDGAANDFVIRRGEETLSFRIVAREVHTPSVSYRMLTDTIGYIHLTAFHGTCVEETKTAMKELREQGMEKLVLDFRDNLGGSLHDAINIADIFLPKDYIVTTLRSRDGKVTEYKTTESGIDIKTVLLVNELSASASELVAGALKDYEAAYLIGTKTYGKGIVQTFFEIPETNGWFKLTTDAYYTPNGVCVQDDGITPDLIVELSEEAEKYSIDYIPEGLDTQLAAAIKYLED
ncbi:MAG: S41 family peptidase [Clostridia bacterium]|nr:S41 family peptidase [Clostridia bacterium]